MSNKEKRKNKTIHQQQYHRVNSSEIGRNGKNGKNGKNEIIKYQKR